MKAIALAALAAAILMATPAGAQDDPNRADVRCLLAMTALMRNPQTQAAGGAGTLYFTGKIDGRDVKFDLQGATKREFSRMDPMEYRREIQRCGEELKVRNEALKAMGEALKLGR